MKNQIKFLSSLALICSVLFIGEKEASAESRIDSDNNTSFNEAKTIQVNANVNGIFENKDDKDYYVLDIKKDGILTINLESKESAYLDVINTDQTTSLKSVTVNTFINITEKQSITMKIKKGKYYMLAQTDGSPSTGGPYLFSTSFINTEKHERVMWGKTELKVGQIGKITILADTKLVKLNKDGSLSIVRTLKKGEEFRVYSYKGHHNGLYGVGGGSFAQKDTTVKYETPSKAKLSLLKQ